MQVYYNAIYVLLKSSYDGNGLSHDRLEWASSSNITIEQNIGKHINVY